MKTSIINFKKISIYLITIIIFLSSIDLIAQSKESLPIIPKDRKIDRNSLEQQKKTSGTPGDAISLNVPGTYATIQSAINAANNGDLIIVAAGTYREDITLNKFIQIRGANYGVNPNTGFRGPESVIQPATSDPDNLTFFYIGANGSGAVIDGFTFDGDNPTLTSIVNINGANIDAAEALGAYDGLANTVVRNNIIKNLNYAGIDFYNFYGEVENTYKNKKVVTFHYRADNGRAWGEGKQVKNVIEFFNILRPYFSKDVLFCVLGDKDKYSFPDWIVDKRIKKYPNPIVYEYSQIIASSVLITSVTGSNMVLPSLLSTGMLVHFVKEPLIRLTGTDVANYKNSINTTTYDHIYIFENGIKSIAPKKLAARLIRLFEGKLSIEYKGYSIDCVRSGKPASSQKEYILQKHSYFNYNKAKELNSELNNQYWRSISGNNLIKRVVSKISRSLLKK